MLKLSYQAFLACVFSIQLFAADDYNFLSEKFDPWNIEFFEEIPEESAPTNPALVPQDNFLHHENSLPSVYYYFPIYNFPNVTTVHINNYYSQPIINPQNIFPAFIPGLCSVGMDNKRKNVEENKADNKRQKIVENNDDNKIQNLETRQEIIYQATSKGQVIRAFLLGIQNGKGGNYINQRDGLLRIDDLDQLLKYTTENSAQSFPTALISSRIKALKRWFDGIPKKPLGKKFDITIKKEMKEKYQKLFNKY